MTSFIQNRVSLLSRLASFVAIFSLFFMIVGDAHALRCLDGQESLISLHFENLEDHHQEGQSLHKDSHEDVHNDYEYEIETDTLQSKLSKLNQHFLVDTFPGLALTLNTQYYSHSSLVDSFKAIKLFTFLPPLRAPPVSLS